MEKNKYYYNGIPLKNFCKENNIPYPTITGRIRVLLKENENLNLDKAIKKALFQKYNFSSKYFYNGMPLVEYCLKNNISYSTIETRIQALIHKYPNLTLNEIIEKAINKENSIKYYYNGMPLSVYCRQNNISYGTIKSRIRTFLKNNNNMNLDEAIKTVMNESGIKYHYNGISLSAYCKQNNISYQTVISRIKTFLKKNKKAPIDEAIKHALSKKHKYFYNGIPLVEYCKKNNIAYTTIINKIKKYLKENKNATLSEAIKYVLSKKYSVYKYYYNGIPLIEYCKKNNLNYRTITNRIISLSKKHLNFTLNEIIEKAVNMNYRTKYYYYDTPLSEYCKKNNISYTTIISRIKNNEIDIQLDDKVIFAIENTPEPFIPNQTKYYYNNESLVNYCKKNNINISRVYDRLKILKKKYSNVSENELIIIALEDIRKYDYMPLVRNIFSKINDQNNEKNLKEMCEKLQIDYDNFIKLKKKANFSNKKLLSIIWFYSKSNNDELKQIEINDFIKIIYNINEDKNYNSFEILFELFKRYKCGFDDNRLKILELLEKRIYKIIRLIEDEYELKLNKQNREDIYSELTLFLFIILERCYENKSPYGFYSYINKSLYGYALTYIFKKNNFFTTSLDKTDSTNKSLYDYIDSNGTFNYGLRKKR